MQYLLQKHGITPNKLLGQNFMIDHSLFPMLINYAAITHNDVVLDVGAGFGFLTRYVADKCKAVIAVEKDSNVAKVLSAQAKDLTNVIVINGDVLRVALPAFNKVVSLPPYYLSSQLVTWLLDHSFECAILVVQKEFARKLVAPVGSDEYGWLNVITYPYAKAELLDDVPKWMFYPQPEVDSVILKLEPSSGPSFVVKDIAFFRRLTKWLFTQRNKKICNSLASFIKSENKLDNIQVEKVVNALALKDRRSRELSPKEFGELANALLS